MISIAHAQKNKAAFSKGPFQNGELTALHVIPSVLKCSYRVLKKALNEPSVSNLSASAEQEISKDGTVMAHTSGSLLTTGQAEL